MINLNTIRSNGSKCVSQKDYGGLGILDTRKMNEALLEKWVWRILRADNNDMCYNLLKKKYLKTKAYV